MTKEVKIYELISISTLDNVTTIFISEVKKFIKINNIDGVNGVIYKDLMALN